MSAIRILNIFKYILLGFSYLIPRNKKIWCFGSTFRDNAKYLYIYMFEKTKDIKCVWIGDEEDVKKVSELGFRAYKRWSFYGLWYELVAGAYVFNSYPANVNLFTMGRAKRINLWHGIALKCIDRKIKVGPVAERYHAKGLMNEIRYLNFRIKPHVVLSTAPIMTDNFSEAFDVGKDRIIEGIYPRCQLLNRTEDEILYFIRNYESEECLDVVHKIKKFNYTYIYMPTWRDNGGDLLRDCGFDFNIANEALKMHDRLLIIKLHPDAKVSASGSYSNIFFIDKNVDIYPILPFTNCLITDFSSIYFDYILMDGKQILLFLPDFDDYINNNRDLAYPYDEVMKGKKIMEFSNLIDEFTGSNTEMNTTELVRVRNIFWNSSNDSMRKLVDAFKGIVNG